MSERDTLRAALDAALSTLDSDDVMYDQPVAMSGEPMDPQLFVPYERLRAALAATPVPELDVERLARAITIHRQAVYATGPQSFLDHACMGDCATDIAAAYAKDEP